jgi:hypothetical protein
MNAKKQPITNKKNVTEQPVTEQQNEVHVCCYDEGGFYFAADLSGFIINTFHELGELCAWLLNYNREVTCDEGHIVIHAHKPAVMRPHPVFEDLDEELQQKIIKDWEKSRACS